MAGKVKTKEEITLLKFLTRTKEGKYAQIDKSSLPYARLEIKRELCYEEEYYYSSR